MAAFDDLGVTLETLARQATAARVALTEAGQAVERGTAAAKLQADAGRQTEAGAKRARDVLLGLALSVKGLALAGIRQSLEGDRLRLAFDRLTFQIGGVFRPTLIAVIRTLDEVTYRLQTMHGVDQERIRLLTTGTAAALLFSRVLGGLGFSFGLVSGTVSALVGVIATTQEGKELLRSLAGLFQKLQPVLEGATSVLAGFIGVLTRFVDFLTGAADTIKGLIPGGQGDEQNFVGKTLGGAAVGAAAGSVFPFLGTLLGSLLGAAGGYLSAALGGGRSRQATQAAREDLTRRGPGGSGRSEDLYLRIQQAVLKNDVALDLQRRATRATESIDNKTPARAGRPDTDVRG